MLELADGRPTRRYRNGVTIPLYPCSVCEDNLVAKKGGLCVVCAARKREAGYIANGIKHPANRTYAGSKPPLSGRTAKKTNGCVPHWMIDELNFGRCTKGDRCDIKSRALLCKDTGLPCPHNGVRDFARLQGKTPKKLYALKSNRKGGKKSGKIRGGRRGRPRKLE